MTSPFTKPVVVNLVEVVPLPKSLVASTPVATPLVYTTSEPVVVEPYTFVSFDAVIVKAALLTVNTPGE